MEKIALIDVQVIKDYYTPAQNNIDDRTFKVHVIEAQDKHLKYVLSKPLFYDFMEQYEEFSNNGGNINDFVSAEYQYIKKKYIEILLVYGALIESKFDLQSKLTNKGDETQSSDFSTPSTKTTYRMEQIQQLLDEYKDELIDYLNANKTKYPLYNPSEDSGDLVSGIYFPKRNRC